jgi:hypothetical protein
MPRLSKIGAAALAAFGWTGGASVSVSYLVVAGGGGGATGVGGSANGGGGGAGGYQAGTTSLNPTLSYTVTVGAGGSTNASGSNSQLGALTASVGGGSGGYNTGNGQTGGSGGGASSYVTSTAGSGTSGQGNAGGTQVTNVGTGGGGGASSVGGNASGVNGGNGGSGTASSISGSSVTYAGGGGGSTNTGGTAGTGGSGGGGAGGVSAAGTSGTANLGGGGGGGASSASGGSGGSGIVIISYAGAQQFGGGVVTSVGGNTIHTFTTSGTLSPITSLSASYLVVAGGGGGGTSVGGGGGAGGLLTGSGLIIDTNSIYAITVGAGGAGSTSYTAAGTTGSNSQFNSITSTGGGGGGSEPTSNTGAQNGLTGGSGGGGGSTTTGVNGTGGTATSGQGNAGAGGRTDNATYRVGGGGGGAGSAGSIGTLTTNGAGGAGGSGTASSISGSSITYAGGGGGSPHGSGTAGAGGSGGGGNSGTSSSQTGVAGTANLGGGGGAGGNEQVGAGGQGGSGVVIISYAGATQQMAGGTVTIVGGNVIHTFTSSGYLTPIKLVNNSLRFRSSASAYLNRTNGTPTNANIYSFSFWVKRGTIGVQNNLVGAGQSSGTNYAQFTFGSSDTLTYSESGVTWNLTTTQVFRDPSAWYHLIFVYDSTQATSTNRAKIYVNGVQVTALSSAVYPALNSPSYFNTSGYIRAIGNIWYNGAPGGFYSDCYMTEMNFIDGQALTPNSFGTFNSYGVWQPITYGGSYGINGFYLPFTNNASTTTLGYDFSPNGNNWTTNNISVTAGVTYDSMTDVPTLTSATAANYAVLNPLDIPTSGSPATLSNGNLACVTGNAGYGFTTTTIASSTGKWYWEYVATAGAPNLCLGFGLTTCARTYGGDTGSYIYYAGDGKTYANAGAGVTYGATWTNGDVISVALNLDAGTATFYKNNVSQGTAFTGLTGTFFPIFSDQSPSASNTFTVNFGQQPFTYTPPSGFVALNTYNL